MIMKTMAVATQNNAMLTGLRRVHCLPLRYSCTHPMTNRTSAPVISQERTEMSQTLAPAKPIAPKNPSGKQQASVDSAATTAATGVARSTTLINHLLNASSSFVTSKPTIMLSPMTVTGVVINPNFCSSEIAEGSFVMSRSSN